jgi:hypothetical protein
LVQSLQSTETDDLPENSLVQSDLVNGSEDLDDERDDQDEEQGTHVDNAPKKGRAPVSQSAGRVAKAKRGRKPGRLVVSAKHPGRRNGENIEAREPLRRSSRTARARHVPQYETVSKAVVTRQGTKRQRQPGRRPKPAMETSNEWEVEMIVGSRIDADSLEHFYEVKWEGFSSKENTWEPKLNLTGCHKAIEEYERRAKLN